MFGLKVVSLELVVERGSLDRLLSIMDNNSHCITEGQRSTFSGRLLSDETLQLLLSCSGARGFSVA